MDLQHLREFVMLAETLNFSEAAKKLFITQPVLSRHIADLECRLGVQLFIRTKHMVQLTSLGHLFLVESKAVLARYEETLQKIQLASSGLAGHLKIGFLEGAVRGFLTQFIIHFSRNFPNIELDLLSYDLETLTRALKTNEIDIAFMMSNLVSPAADLNRRIIYRDVLCAVMPISHPLAGEKAIPLSALAGEALIMLTRDQFSGAGDHLLSLFEARKIKPHIVKETSRIDNALLMVEISKGILILPRLHIALANPNICFVRLEDADCCTDVVMAWKKTNPNPSIPPFVKEFDMTYQNILP